MTDIRRGRVIGLAAAVAAAVMLIAGLAVAPAAQAASGAPVQFSDDGIQWSNSYTRALFTGVLLVPGGSVDRVFYVRNNSGQAAKLRVTLYGVATTDPDLAAAMSLSTSLPGRAGAAVPVTTARPCATLNQGQVLADGDSVRLDNVAALGNLNGTGGQGRSVSFSLAITLSSTGSAAPVPNSCPTDSDNTVIGSPEPPTGTGSQPVYHLGAQGWTPSPATASGPTANDPATTDPGVPSTSDQPGGPVVRRLVANTQRLFQENTVAFWLAMVALGALLLLFVNRRRRSDDDRDSLQYPYPPTTQIGTGR
jgi:hypothetical protein